MTDFFDQFFSSLDIVEFIENNLILEGNPFSYTNNGRAFMKEVLRYCAHTLPHSQQAKPVVVLKGRQTGCSTLTAALTTYFMWNEDHKAILHSFPEVGQARRHSSQRLQQLIDDSIANRNGNLPDSFVNKKGVQSLAQKQFHKSNLLFIDGLSKDARRIRGMSVDLICYDEFATTTRTAFDNSLQAAANTAFSYISGGAVIPHFAFGTPEAAGAYFDSGMWEVSDQRHYNLKCQHCGHYYPLFYEPINREEVFTNLTSGTLSMCLDPQGVGCRKINDKMGPALEEGVWKPTKPENKYVGFYVPQYLNGRITKEMIDDQREKMPQRQFFNEVLGKFYSYEEDTLSKKEVIRLTTSKPDTSNWELAPHIKDKQTFMGIDWGARVSGKDDTGAGSYTVVTIISIVPASGQYKLEAAIRLKQKDVDDQIDQILDLVRRYNVRKVVADYGFGHVQAQRLTKHLGSSRFSSNVWSGTAKKLHNYNHDSNMITTSKHNVFDQFFDELRQGRFCFPFSEKAEEELDWLFDHITNIEAVNVEKDGSIIKQYNKKIGKENDGLASLVYAYTAITFFKTNGFSLKGGSQSGKSSRSLAPKAVIPGALGRRSSKQNQKPQNYSRSNRRRR